jgi:hypothetical protein
MHMLERQLLLHCTALICTTAGRVNVTRKQAFEALLTFEMDFEGPHFTELSEGAQDLIRSLLQVRGCMVRQPTKLCTFA